MVRVGIREEFEQYVHNADLGPYISDKCNQHLTLTKSFTKDERTRYFYILRIFPFSLKGDAKIWFNSLEPGCVRSPQDMIYYFSAKYFPAHKKQAALRDIYI